MGCWLMVLKSSKLFKKVQKLTISNRRFDKLNELTIPNS